MIEPAKKRLLEEALAEFKRSPEARKTLAPIFEAALRDRERLTAYGLIDDDALRLLSQFIGHSSGVSQAEMKKLMLVVLFARRMVEHLDQRSDPSANN